MNKLSLYAILMAVLFFSCKTSHKTSNTMMKEAKTVDKWQSLFDGKTFNGWHTYGNTPVGTAWKVSDGAIFLDAVSKKGGALGGDLVTNEDFENFHLKLEWKISKNGNSGIIFNVVDDKVKYSAPYETGPEMQVLDNDGHSDGKIIKHRAGDLYDLISCTKETVKPVGEWNQAEIKLLNGKLDFYLNGTNVVSTTLWDDAWKKMIAASKFKAWPQFGTIRKGKLCLQDHGDNVWYRNIKIKRL